MNFENVMLLERSQTQQATLYVRTADPGDSAVKNLPAGAGDLRASGSIPGSGRSPGEGNGNLIQYSCLEIPWTEEPGPQSMGSQKVGHD